jgi:outer membrane lipopolysaccharide assembly protein LptE/RlpB
MTSTRKRRGRPAISIPHDARTRGSIAATLAAIAAAGFLSCSGCGYTASPALLPQHLKTVAIPVFENATAEARLEQEITDAVVQRFVRDNHLRIVDEKSANAVVHGRVTLYKNSVFGFSSTAQTNEYRVTVSVQITFKDLVKNRELWTDEIVKSANYYVQDVPGQEAKTELDGRKEAILKIADEVLSRSVEGW